MPRVEGLIEGRPISLLACSQPSATSCICKKIDDFPSRGNPHTMELVESHSMAWSDATPADSVLQPAALKVSRTLHPGPVSGLTI
jgi:hypothetical protein